MRTILRRFVPAALAVTLGLVTCNPASGGPPQRVAERSPQLSPRVISTRYIFKTEPGTTERTPAITSGSGITQADWWLFAAQDDSTLVAVKGTDGALETGAALPVARSALECGAKRRLGSSQSGASRRTPRRFAQE